MELASGQSWSNFHCVRDLRFLHAPLPPNRRDLLPSLVYALWGLSMFRSQRMHSPYCAPESVCRCVHAWRAALRRMNGEDRVLECAAERLRLADLGLLSVDVPLSVAGLVPLVGPWIYGTASLFADALR
eukprot:46341-Pleurochrysis_carterae.AAC.2